MDQPSKKRNPANKRQAIKWIVQGVEKCLADQELPLPPTNITCNRFRKNNAEKLYTYRRREDASLVDALYLLANAKSQKEVTNAGIAIHGLMGGEGSSLSENFPIEVTERVIKATASTGLISLSLDLLRRLLQCDAFPSSMAYTAVINALRKHGRIFQIEEILTELGSSYRRIQNLQLKSLGNSVAIANVAAGVDIVAFNAFVASLCDAAVNEVPFIESSSIETDNLDMESFDWTFFNDNNSTAVTSPSEKYLYKALNLLRGNTARTRFALQEDPDIYSYNTLLAATAKCSRLVVSNELCQCIVESCLRGMKQRGIQPDVFTYNARIDVALRAGTSENGLRKESEAIRLIDEVISDPRINIDRYTINHALVPFLRAGRGDEVMNMLMSFFKTNENNSKLASSAFEAFLNTLVKNEEVDFARELLETFFLPLHSRRIQLSQRVRVVRKEPGLVDMDGHNHVYTTNHLISPTTRHFNMLFGGYSKAYRLVASCRRGADSAFYGGSDLSSDLLISLRQKAYSLLDSMLEIGVLVDGFSVSSLMTFPSSSSNITLLLKRTEREIRSELSPAAYRSIISAYGKAEDVSSACWMFFDEMARACEKRGMNVESWNVLLGALAHERSEENRQTLLDPFSSAAAQRNGNRESSDAQYLESNPIFSLVYGKTCVDASLSILGAMRSRRSFLSSSGIWYIPKPNSQTYCQVATVISRSGNRVSNSVLANELFRCAKEDGVSADGRFLNAALRCFGDDIDSAIKAWKSGIGTAALGISSGARNEYSCVKHRANLSAAYNGLMHVCGRANRPDVALRLCYAMSKAGIEPTEANLNSYYGGKRIAMNGSDGRRRLDLKNQFESLLTVECTKYNTNDRRRAGDKKIRIILS
ncbi:hypothetical protein HJC23_009935 [Cyclotella cryptica]|uniref:Pentatricopeptide repeat-containing protein n=1 Tax=Cyclotella cryptica TaxID=29204 RepID=A0ABD3NYZ9_9STRA